MFTLINNLGVNVTYTDTVGRITEIFSGAHMVTPINPGATVDVDSAFRGVLAVPTASEPVTSLLMPLTSVQYLVLQTTTSDTVTLHGSQWPTLLITNATDEPATFRMNNLPEIDLDGNSSTDVPVPTELVSTVAATSVIGAFMYNVNPETDDIRTPSLAFRPASSESPGMYVTKQAPGIWGQAGIIKTPLKTYIGGWTITGPPATLLAEPTVLPSTSSSCSASRVF